MTLLEYRESTSLKEQKEFAEEVFTIEYGLGYNDFSGFHNHCLTHSNSYRDILYDMYIAG